MLLHSNNVCLFSSLVDKNQSRTDHNNNAKSQSKHKDTKCQSIIVLLIINMIIVHVTPIIIQLLLSVYKSLIIIPAVTACLDICLERLHGSLLCSELHTELSASPATLRHTREAAFSTCCYVPQVKLSANVITEAFT